MTSSGPARAAARSLPSPPRWLLTAVALVALMGTGCSNAPGETGGGGGGGGGQDNPSAAAPDSATLHELQKKLPEYALCMRANGVKDFPDPGPDGIVQYYGDSHSAAFTSATRKCADILPEDRGPNP